MFKRGNIITIGIEPAWDVTCSVNGIEWGDHKVLDTKVSMPAGKALNVSKALAWLGHPSVASGLWGQEDYDDMAEQLKTLSSLIDIRFTPVRGRTRENITISDTVNKREMHLRQVGTLANKGSIRRMHEQILPMIESDDIIVFSGSMPEGKLLEDIISLIWACKQRHANVILDSSGYALEKIVQSGQVSLISPSISELEELLSSRVKSEPEAVMRGARKLINHVPAVMVSMGSDGAVYIGREGCFHAHYVGNHRDVLNTVAGGDTLLAGFVAGMRETDDVEYALIKGVRLATGFVFGMCRDHEPWELEELVEIEINAIG